MYFDMYDHNDYFTRVALFAGITIVLYLCLLAVSLVLYVLRCIGFMTLARRRELPNPWLVWIPVIGDYTVGAVADDISAKEGENSIFRFLLPGGNILNLIFSISMLGSITQTLLAIQYFDSHVPYSINVFSLLGIVVSIALYVLSLVALNRIFRCYIPGYATLWTVLCAIPFLSCLQSIFPFVIRNNQPNWLRPYYEEPSAYAPPSSPQDGYHHAPPPDAGDASDSTPPSDPEPPTS